MSDIPSGEFTFRPMSVLFGTGLIDRIGEKVRELGAKRAFVVTVPPLVTNTDLVEKLTAALGSQCTGVYSGIIQHVPQSCVIEGAAMARAAGADLLISIGGSSTSDAAKAINLVLTESDRGEEFFTKYDRTDVILSAKFEKPKLPIIAIPTTLAGSEYNGSTGVTSETRHVKDTFRAASLTPRLVLLDPEMTVFTRGELWSSTALKILADCFEACYSPHHQPIIDAMVLHSARLINRNLIPSMAEPLNLEARAQLQHASWMVSYAGWGVVIGLIASLRQQIGAIYNIGHGVASTILFPYGVECNRPFIDAQLVSMAPAFDISTDRPDAADAVVQRIRDLIRESGLPSRLRDVGVPKEGLQSAANAGMKGAWIKNSPRPVSADLLLDVLEKAW